MITFDSVNPPNLENLRIAIAYEFFFENYGEFLDRAVKENKTNKELVDVINEVLKLSFGMANLFVHRASLTQEEDDLEHI